MTLGERLVRWALVIGFALLALVSGLAAALIFWTGQPGNTQVLAATALGSAAIAYFLRKKLRRTS